MQLKFNETSQLYIPESPLLMDATGNAKIQVWPYRLRAKPVNYDNCVNQALSRHPGQRQYSTSKFWNEIV
jgi:hypothetical protein